MDTILSCGAVSTPCPAAVTDTIASLHPIHIKQLDDMAQKIADMSAQISCRVDESQCQMMLQACGDPHQRHCGFKINVQCSMVSAQLYAFLRVLNTRQCDMSYSALANKLSEHREKRFPDCV
ncbi:hypothetical protein BV898_13318 [Hypsibius exemplaris]|uniref:Uncharacterized protein n=1 Tax=Hypsibius exemplaris TaxID=2072580 RepID=A0A1W0WBA0_HYPEX|nr:hypothetical protein BV898_13318 [Hypsibius exemplaris]